MGRAVSEDGAQGARMVDHCLPEGGTAPRGRCVRLRAWPVFCRVSLLMSRRTSQIFHLCLSSDMLSHIRDAYLPVTLTLSGCLTALGGLHSIFVDILSPRVSMSQCYARV